MIPENYATNSMSFPSIKVKDHFLVLLCIFDLRNIQHFLRFYYHSAQTGSNCESFNYLTLEKGIIFEHQKYTGNMKTVT